MKTNGTKRSFTEPHPELYDDQDDYKEMYDRGVIGSRVVWQSIALITFIVVTVIVVRFFIQKYS